MKINSCSFQFFLKISFLCLTLWNSFTIAETLPLPKECDEFTAVPKHSNDKVYDDYPFSDGMLWKVSKEGKNNFIYGTIHTQDQRATRFSPKVRLSIFQSENYLMEIKLSQETNDVFQKNMFYQNEETLVEKISPELLRLLKTQVTDYGFEAKQAEKMKPWAIFSTIGTPKPVRALTLDQMLMNFAQSRGHNIIGIETMQELVDTLASIDLQDQMAIMTDTICNRPKIIKESWKLVQYHMFNNLRGMVEFNEQPHHDEKIFDRYMDTMVYQRNNRIFERVLPYFEQGNGFAAIGALHLPGEKGLLQKFADNGFTIEVIE